MEVMEPPARLVQREQLVLPERLALKVHRAKRVPPEPLVPSVQLHLDQSLC